MQGLLIKVMLAGVSVRQWSALKARFSLWSLLLFDVPFLFVVEAEAAAASLVVSEGNNYSANCNKKPAKCFNMFSATLNLYIYNI